MGDGKWDGDVYTTVTSRDAFTFHSDATARGDYVSVHPTLDPKGVGLRESRDNDEHPESLAITIGLDLTGSNIRQAEIVHKQLPQLMGLIVRKGILSDPQIMVAAINDMTAGDPVPSQISEWESDNRIDLNLGNMRLLGGGGGGIQESYELLWYFLARHTAMDCLEKRGQKGLLYVVGDEEDYPVVRASHVRDVFGDTLQADIPTDEIVRELLGKFDVVFYVPRYSSNGGNPRIAAHWRKRFGEQNVDVVEDASDIVPMIAGDILSRVGVDSDTIVSDIAATGATTTALATLKSSLAKRPSSPGLATVAGDLTLSGSESHNVRI